MGDTMKAEERDGLMARFGRAGLSQRVCDLIKEFNERPTYKAAIELAGRLSVIAGVAMRENYWGEKCSIGRNLETEFLQYHRPLISKDDQGNVESVAFEWFNAAGMR